MSWMYHDPDEWEPVAESGSYGTFCGVPTGWASFGQRRRAPEEVARIKAERLRAEEDEVLRRSDEIRATRAAQ